jgi:hypothetical protein
MNSSIPKRKVGPSPKESYLVRFFEALDRSIPALRTAFLGAGILAAAAQSGTCADALFVTGLLFQFAIWFQDWSLVQESR